MTPSCSSISYFPSAQTRNSRNGPTATFPEDSIPAHAGKTPGMDTTSHCVSAHPRSRGENALQPEGPTLRSGSSPLTRGKLGLAVVAVGALGLIPAHAGKTRRRSPRALGRAAHPRSRGENDPSRRQRLQPHGSSPLTRGKRPFPLFGKTLKRLIPAHAGKTLKGQEPTRVRAAHPRSRGENFRTAGPAFTRSGSSPLTRGKPLSSPSLPAHPRSRGENMWRPNPASSSCGSSPLTRGKHDHRDGLESFLGLIPAHAGKTASSADRRAWRQAHPRSRGENSALADIDALRNDSSPLTRGKLQRRVNPELKPRLIPAHAGKTSGRPSPTGAAAAHPRSRGENALMMRSVLAIQGSSPLTRGKPCARVLSSVVPRLIPAHAGKTTGCPTR